MKSLAILFVSLLPVGALALDGKKTFDVASIKRAVPPVASFHGTQNGSGSSFGPGTSDPTRWACSNCSLSNLLMEAYQLKRFQITGPKWLDSERYDITARVAEGATKEDLRLMQQSLLAGRFGLKSHLAQTDMPVYDLVVVKRSPNLKEAAPASPETDRPAEHQSGHGGPSAGGFAGHASGKTSTFTMHGNTRHQAVSEDMQTFAGFLASQLERPVTDSTGLKSSYDFVLTFSATNGGDGFNPRSTAAHGDSTAYGGASHGDDAEAAPPLLKAIQDQLGLRLEVKKGRAGVLIVDVIERVPSEN